MNWQPIETAPKEGKCMFWLEFSDDSKHLNPPLEFSPWSKDQIFIGQFRRWASIYKATHWMPLPDPPKERGVK